jgi:hypothetical protein
MSRCVTRPSRIFAGPFCSGGPEVSHIAALCWRAPLHRLSTLSNMAAATSASTPIAGRFRPRTTIPVAHRSLRTEDNDRSSKPRSRQDRSKTDPKTDTQTAPAAAPAPAPAEQRRACRPGASSRPAARPNRRPGRCARRYRDRPPAPQVAGYRAASGKTCAGSNCRHGPSGTSACPCPCHRSGRQFAARRLADRGEGRQGPDRAMRRQSVRLCRRQEVETRMASRC